jgi:sugar/nucleoside kinase (ribokinase family)
MKASVICIGAAVQDVFLRGGIFKPHHDKAGDVEEFKLGSKNTVDEVIFSTGGGATNAAVTFARQGMQAYYMGKIGDDIAGLAVSSALHLENVNTSLMGVNRRLGTGYSVLLLAPSGERTILVYRGASTHYNLESRDFHGTPADWFYVTSLEGNFNVLETVFTYAAKHNIKIAINPGKKELAEPDKLRRLLKHSTILSLNKEELSMLFKGDTLADLVTEAGKVVPYVVGTDGPKGCIATDGTKLYKAGMYEDVRVIDRTGAGDAFCSGFTAMIIHNQSMEHAITFASANSTSVVKDIGAKTGILQKSAKIHSMPIQVSNI